MRARTSRRRVAAVVVGAGFGVIAAASPALAADRAYELVTPPGGAARVLPGTGMSAPNGNVVCFDAESVVADAQMNGEIAPDGHCSWRTPTGWETRWVTGPGVNEPRGGYGSAVFFLAPDGSRVAFATDKGLNPDFGGDRAPGNLAGTQSAYLWEGGGMPRWLAPTPEPAPDPNTNRNPVAASQDVRQGLFQSGLRLVPQDTNTAIDVYQWTPDGIRLVSRNAAGEAVGGTYAGKITAAGLNAPFANPGSMSRDGSRTFFQHSGPIDGEGPDLVENVFMRQGETLVHVSPRRGGDVPSSVFFAGASDDGRIVYLQSDERLTPEPKQFGSAIYRYEVASDTLSLVATDPAQVTFLGLSADGSTVVFRTGGFLEVGDVRVARDGAETTLGTLDFQDVDGYNTIGSGSSSERGLRIARDGSAVAFSAIGSFAGVPAGRRQAYLWNPGQGVRHISATWDGAPPAGDAQIGSWSVSNGIGIPRVVGLANTLRKYPNVGRVLSDDGRVFFETEEQLVPADVNASVDVYEWRDGAAHLISPGTQDAHAFYHDNSADGDTVFFVTAARVIPELDRNTTTDLYAARVGGGFPLPERTPECAGELCQGPLVPTPPLQAPGSTGFEGPGDQQDAAPVDARHSVMRITARQRRAFARRGHIVLRVRANVNGAVTATANARLGRRTVRVAQSTEAVRSGATAKVRLSLSRRARNVLRARRRLRVTINVSYSESDASVRRVVVLRG